MNVRKFGFVLLLWCALFSLGGLSFAGEEPLSVTGGEPVIYVCDNGDRVVARYYALSDESLRFVKVLFSDGREYTLPQVLSASGARYTDDMELVWWIKGDQAYVEKRDEAGEWQPYGDCQVSEQVSQRG